MDLNEDYNIIVISPTSVGKTSFLNKLLYQNDLPVNRKPNTYCNLKIRHSDKINLIHNKKIIESNIKEELENLNNKYKNSEQKDEIVLNTIYSYNELKPICFIDTPGIDNIKTREKTLNLCKIADCVILLLSIETENKKIIYDSIPNKNIKVVLIEKQGWEENETPQEYLKKELGLKTSEDIFDVQDKNYESLIMSLISLAKVSFKKIAERNYNKIKERLLEMYPGYNNETERIKKLREKRQDNKFKFAGYCLLALFSFAAFVFVPVLGISVLVAEMSTIIVTLAGIGEFLIVSGGYMAFILTANFAGYYHLDNLEIDKYINSEKFYKNQEVKDKNGILRYKGGFLGKYPHGKGQIYDDNGNVIFEIISNKGEIITFIFKIGDKIKCTNQIYYSENWKEYI